ncbi:MAG: hypothetical protein MZV63_22990 [Marinilabiliales bacterium]|nr:hypothetical protein [Marinilabiliales bacterium]
MDNIEESLYHIVTADGIKMSGEVLTYLRCCLLGRASVILLVSGKTTRVRSPVKLLPRLLYLKEVVIRHQYRRGF